VRIEKAEEGLRETRDMFKTIIAHLEQKK
jgi:hypothetical protein